MRVVLYLASSHHHHHLLYQDCHRFISYFFLTRKSQRPGSWQLRQNPHGTKGTPRPGRRRRRSLARRCWRCSRTMVRSRVVISCSSMFDATIMRLARSFTRRPSLSLTYSHPTAFVRVVRSEGPLTSQPKACSQRCLSSTSLSKHRASAK